MKRRSPFEIERIEAVHDLERPVATRSVSRVALALAFVGAGLISLLIAVGFTLMMLFPDGDRASLVQRVGGVVVGSIFLSFAITLLGFARALLSSVAGATRPKRIPWAASAAALGLMGAAMIAMSALELFRGDLRHGLQGILLGLSAWGLAGGALHARRLQSNRRRAS